MDSQDQTALDRLLTRDEAAAVLRVKKQTLAKWACAGGNGLPYIRVGGRVVYRTSDIERFLAARTQGGQREGGR